MKTRLIKFFNSEEQGVFLYTPKKGKSYLFTGHVTEIKCVKYKEIGLCLKLARKFTEKGMFCAGYAEYEASYGLLKGLNKNIHKSGTLLHFGVYRRPFTIKNCSLKSEAEFGIVKGKESENLSSYKKKFTEIICALKNGDAYQVNLCFRIPYSFKGNPAALFAALCEAQEVKYAAFLRLGNRTIISVSPELFFEIEGRDIKMRPMKGTLLKEQDPGPARAEKKLRDEKGIAENVMITDMLRNDLGKICESGSIRVPKLFSVEEYSTLYQMTSTIRGRLKKGTGIDNVFSALFPSGSVTGAPKVSAMNIINRLEDERRGVYTGAIGFAGKDTAIFNVPIRTIEIKGKTAEMGVGSGIVYDSKAADEYRECMGKAEFVRKAGQGFGLIESMMLKDGRIFLPVEHLKRMWESARFFGMRFNQHEAEHMMKKAALKFNRGVFKLKLLLDKTGLSFECYPVTPLPEGKVMISSRRMESADVFLRHKTTLRHEYDTDYKKTLKAGLADIIYMNEKEELTEAHSSNIFIERNGKYYTPPVSCGLLPGTLRGHLLKRQPETYKEKVLKIKDIEKAGRVFLCNSVRGMREFNLK